jgi:hypothetical protein
MKRGSSSSRSDWLCKTGCILRSFYFRRDETEFPMASSRIGGACNCWTFWGLGATGRVRHRRTLRPLNNLVKIEDKHELAIIRETPAPRARSLSTEGRARTVSRAAAPTGSKENIILATDRRIFHRQRRGTQTSDSVAQWRRTAAASAATAAAFA